MDVRFLCRFIISLLFTFTGLAGCICFLILNLYTIATLAVFTGICGLISSWLHILAYRRLLNTFYEKEQIWQFGQVGFYVFAGACATTVYYLVAEIHDMRAILPLNDSAVIPMIWGLITLKAGLYLKLYANHYSINSNSLLIPDIEEESGSSTCT